MLLVLLLFDSQFNLSHRPGTAREQKRIKYSRPYARHILLISQNDSKPFPVRRLFKTIPTKKAIKVLDKLYSYRNYKSKPNMKLNYDIFDPQYSSKNASPMTKSSYRKLKKNSGHYKPSKSPENRHVTSTAHPNSHLKARASGSDKKEFFLRNTISNKTDHEIKSVKKVTAHQNKNDSNLDCPSKKCSMKGMHSKNGKKKTSANSANIDLKKALDEYYSSFLKKMKPVWTYDIGSPKMSYLKRNDEKRYHQPYLEVNGQKREEVGSNSTLKSNATILAAKSPSKRRLEERNLTNALTPQKMKEQSGYLRSLIEKQRIGTGFNVTSIDLRPMSFQSLEGIDSGNYTIYRLAKDSILINLQSKSGELQTFFGKAASNSERKRRLRHKIKTRKQLVLHLASNEPMNVDRKPAEESLHHREGIVRKSNKSRKMKHLKTSKPTKLVDNMKYFQSSLQVEPGSARTFGKRKAKSRKSKKKVEKKHSKAVKNGIKENGNRTAYDLYDNRLARVEKQRQYFFKNNPDRLVITEKSDPFTDSSTVKLFVNSGDENSLMPSESLGFSRSEGALKNTISDAPGHLSDRNELDRYDDIFPQEDGSKHDKVERDDKADKNARSERETAKTVERKAAENENIDYAVSPKHGLRKIVEEPKSDKKEETKSKEKKEEHENEEKRKKESDAKKANDNDHSKKNANDSSSEVKTNSENLSKNYERKNEKKQNASVDHENMKKENDNKNKEKKNKKAEKSNKEKDEDVWLFKPDETKEAYDDSESAKNATSKTEEKQANSSSILKEGNKTDDKQRQSSFNEAKVANEDSIIGEVGQALGKLSHFLTNRPGRHYCLSALGIFVKKH